MTTSTTDPFKFTSGPRDAKVLIVGEAWGSEEARQQLPFVGTSGNFLTQLLHDAKIDRKNCLITNVISQQPPGNDFKFFLHPNIEKTYNHWGIHPRRTLMEALEKLKTLISTVNPELIIGCGNIPLWALTDKAGFTSQGGYKYPSGITKWRGSQLHIRRDMHSEGRYIPYLPILHPALILREYKWRYPTVHDLRSRAGRFLSGERPSWLLQDRTHTNSHPTYAQAIGKLHYWQKKLAEGPFWISADIETWNRQFVTCIGLADGDSQYCFPFFHFDDNAKVKDVYSESEEANIWLGIKDVLEHSNARVIGQNFIYDHQFLSRQYRIKAKLSLDTMLAHHLLWPGTPKSLDYLASLYLDHYIYWKDESSDWSGKGDPSALWFYNTKDTRATYDIAMELRRLLSDLKLDHLYEFQLEQWHLAAKMMAKGVAVDRNRLNALRTEMMNISARLESQLLEYMPVDLRTTAADGFWFDSPIRSMEIFYSILGLRPITHKKTGRPTFSTEAFTNLRKQAAWLTPIFNDLEDYRSVEVFQKHFLDLKLSPDGRLRCNFNVGGTDTYRWSSSRNGFGEGTNFQNIPKGDKD